MIGKEMDKYTSPGPLSQIEKTYKYTLLTYHELERGNFLAQLTELGKNGWKVIAVLHDEILVLEKVTFGVREE